MAPRGEASAEPGAGSLEKQPTPQRASSAVAVLVAAWTLLVGVGGLKLHYLLWGRRSAAECLVATPAVVTAANAAYAWTVGRAFDRAGLPRPTATVSYAPDLSLDVYEAREDFFFEPPKPKPRRSPRRGAPQETSPRRRRPACLYFHAGAWVTGTRRLGGAPLGGLLSRVGVVGFSASYRLASERSSAGLRGALEDAGRAHAWVVAHADEYEIDSGRLFLMGDSAGALLALATCLRGAASSDAAVPPCAAVVLGWPAVSVRAADWASLTGHNVFVPDSIEAADDRVAYAGDHVLSGLFLLFGRTAAGWLPPPAYVETDAAMLSPLAALEETASSGGPLIEKPPPLYVAAAADDTVVPVSQVDKLRAAYRNYSSSSATVATFEDADHGDGHYYARAGRAALLDFLKERGLLDDRLGDAGLSTAADAAELDALAGMLGAKTDYKKVVVVETTTPGGANKQPGGGDTVRSAAMRVRRLPGFLGRGRRGDAASSSRGSRDIIFAEQQRPSSSEVE